MNGHERGLRQRRRLLNQVVVDGFEGGVWSPCGGRSRQVPEIKEKGWSKAEIDTHIIHLYDLKTQEIQRMEGQSQ